MKNLFILTLFAFLLIGTMSALDENCSGVYLDGIRAYYQFNETNGTIIDSAGLYNISSITGSVVQGVEGKIGNAINFTDGFLTSSYQNCSGVPMTINFWAYSVDGEHRVFISEDDGGFDPLIQYTGSEYSFSIGNFDGGTATISGSSIITNEWVMLTGVVLENRTAYFYQNATLVGTGYSGYDGSCHNYYIGGYDGSNFKHNERMDEVMFFAKALNQSEISALYNEGQSCYVTLEPTPEEPEEPTQTFGTGQAIYDIMNSSGAGIGILLQILVIALPLLLIGVAMAVIFVKFGNSLAKGFSQFKIGGN